MDEKDIEIIKSDTVLLDLYKAFLAQSLKLQTETMRARSIELKRSMNTETPEKKTKELPIEKF